MFQPRYIVSTISTPVVIFEVVKMNPNTKTLVLDRVILIYISNILNEGTYKFTPRLTNVYYERAPLYRNK